MTTTDHARRDAAIRHLESLHRFRKALKAAQALPRIVPYPPRGSVR